YDGFKWLSSDDFTPGRNTTDLTISAVKRIHFSGGSILRTARTSLLNSDQLRLSTVVMPDDQKIARVIENLRKIRVQYLITIGGDDTALSARFVSERSEGAIRVVNVPKTIDNDLPLPGDINTFGFSSARYWGTLIVKNLMADSLTTGRWYLVTAM